MDDAKRAIEAGVDGVDLVIGTSSYLQKYSHGKSIEIITKSALPYKAGELLIGKHLTDS